MSKGTQSSFNQGERWAVALAILLLLAAGWGMMRSESGDFATAARTPIVGRITATQNDARARGAGGLDFTPARNGGEVHRGDSVFTGPASSATVNLTRGGHVVVGANSLVVFNEDHGQSFLSLGAGNFRVHVDGEMRVEIDGKPTTLRGLDSDIQIVAQGNQRTQVNLLRGTAVMLTNGVPVQLLTAERPVLPGVRNPPGLTVATTALPPPAPGAIDYVWRLDDLYDAGAADTLTPRANPRELLSVEVNLPVAAEFAQIDRTATFLGPRPVEVKNHVVALREAFLLGTFLRVSHDGRAWSAPVTITVNPLFRPDAPRARVRAGRVILGEGGLARGRIEFASRDATRGFVVQGTRIEAPDDQRTFVIGGPRLALEWDQPGTYRYRARAIDAAGRLSTWSDQVTIRVDRATPERRLASTTVAPPASAAISPVEVPAAAATISTAAPRALDPPIDPWLFTHSRLGGGMFSRTNFATEANRAGTSVWGASIGGVHWWRVSGVAGFVHSSLASSDASVSFRDLEVRYLRRTRWWRAQWSGFVGGEMYRASGRQFSNGYDLLNVGGRLDLALTSRAYAGGELSYGASAGSDRKMAANGFLGYLFRRAWAIVAGYRLTFVSKSGLAASETGEATLEREGYAEAYSTMNYFF